MCELGQILCPDCDGMTVAGFTLAVNDGRLVTFSKCATCYSKGDSRSLRGFISVNKQSYVYAVKNGLPVVQLVVVKP